MTEPHPSGPAAYVGADPIPALGSGLLAVCADACGIVDEPRGRVTEVPAPARAGALALLEQAAVREWLTRSAGAVVVWKPSVRIAELVRATGRPLANARAQVARRLENKAHFARTAPGAWLPLAPTVVGPAGPQLLEAALGLKGPWVVQLASGYSGRTTRLAETPKALAAALHADEGRSCRVATFVAGDPVTVTGVIGDARIALGVACRQLTGIDVLTPHPLGSCGNDFGRPLAAEAAVRSVAARAAAWLQREGHRGLFGVDLVVAADDTVFCIEVNPRLVASVPLWNLAARDAGRPSILAEHVSVFDPAATGTLPERLTCGWSQLILHNLGSVARTVDLASGVGTVGPDGGFQHQGPLPLDGPRPGEGALVVHRRAAPQQEVARLILEGELADGRGRLLPGPAALVADVRRRLEASSR